MPNIRLPFRRVPNCNSGCSQAAAPTRTYICTLYIRVHVNIHTGAPPALLYLYREIPGRRRQIASNHPTCTKGGPTHNFPPIRGLSTTDHRLHAHPHSIKLCSTAANFVLSPPLPSFLSPALQRALRIPSPVCARSRQFQERLSIILFLLYLLFSLPEPNVPVFLIFTSCNCVR